MTEIVPRLTARWELIETECLEAPSNGYRKRLVRRKRFVCLYSSLSDQIERNESQIIFANKSEHSSSYEQNVARILSHQS